MQLEKESFHKRRRNKLPNAPYQLRLVGSILAFCTLALIVQSLVVGAQFANIAHDLTHPNADALGLMNSVLMRSLIIAGLLVLPALALIAVQRTFRIAGPLYRFEQHLKSVSKGEWPGTCKIRKGDDHQELCDLINSALESARQMGRESANELKQSSKKEKAA